MFFRNSNLVNQHQPGKLRATGQFRRLALICLASLASSYGGLELPLVVQAGAQTASSSATTQNSPDSRLTRQILADLGRRLLNCWNVAADATPPPPIRLKLLPDGGIDGHPAPVPSADGNKLSKAEWEAATRAMRSITICTPFLNAIPLAGREITLTFNPEAYEINAQLSSSEQAEEFDDELTDSELPSPELSENGATEPATGAFDLLIEIERNGAAAIQKRAGQPHRYILTPDRTTLENGIVVLQQDVGMNYVAYATIYCAFTDSHVDATSIQVGMSGTYSAVLYDVNVTQRWADSGQASGMINFKEIVLTSCELAD